MKKIYVMFICIFSLGIISINAQTITVFEVGETFATFTVNFQSVNDSSVLQVNVGDQFGNLYQLDWTPLSEPETTVTVIGLPAGTYFGAFAYRAHYSEEFGGPSYVIDEQTPNVLFNTLQQVNIEENNTPFFSIYPNPTSDFINISGINPKTQNLQILSLDGKLILEKYISENHQLTIDVQALPIGNYIIKTEKQTSLFIKK